MTTMPNNRIFATTSSRGLHRELPPMRLWQKAKKFGVWNPFKLSRQGSLPKNEAFLPGLVPFPSQPPLL
jgi:hypothetical protein